MAIYVCTQFDLVLLSVEFFAAYLQITFVSYVQCVKQSVRDAVIYVLADFVR